MPLPDVPGYPGNLVAPAWRLRAVVVGNGFSTSLPDSLPEDPMNRADEFNRRDLLKSAGVAAAAVAASSLPLGWAKADEAKPKETRKVLMFTKSQAFQHS